MTTQSPYLVYRGTKPPDQLTNLSGLCQRGNVSDRKTWWGGSSTTSESMTDLRDNEDRKTPLSILRRFANRTSMQGVQFLSTSRSWYARVIWTVLLLTSLSLLTWHLTYLVQLYYSWPKHSSMNLGFANLNFPAVTICNLNPIRSSRLDLASYQFRDLIKSANPHSMAEELKRHREMSYNQSIPLPTTMNDAQPATTTSPPDILDMEETTESMNFINGLNFSFTNSSRMNMTLKQRQYDGAEMGLTEKSASTSIQQQFQFMFIDEPRKQRIRMGHQISDMLLDCSFSCQRCRPQNFTRFTSSYFGNCYTLQNIKFKSRRSGPLSGLQLIIYLETNEFLPGVTTGNGMQVVVHEPGTFPFPSNDGMAVAAGTETNIALRLLKISRLGPPNWECEDGRNFQDMYNLTYTRQTCQTVCEQRHIVTKCGCYDNKYEEINRATRFAYDYPACNIANMECLYNTTWSFERHELTCDCGNPCQETKYEKTLSSRQWPSQSYSEVLKQTLCSTMSEKDCVNLKHNLSDSDALRENFIKLNIYFEDLNYENITEEADYEFLQFIADVGGTLGLWVGLSVLSIFEVVQLVLELLTFFTCGIWRNPDVKKDDKNDRKQPLTLTDSCASEKINPNLFDY